MELTVNTSTTENEFGINYNKIFNESLYQNILDFGMLQNFVKEIEIRMYGFDGAKDIMIQRNYNKEQAKEKSLEAFRDLEMKLKRVEKQIEDQETSDYHRKRLKFEKAILSGKMAEIELKFSQRDSAINLTENRERELYKHLRFEAYKYNVERMLQEEFITAKRWGAGTIQFWGETYTAE